MKRLLIIAIYSCLCLSAFAQDEEEEETGFQKKNLFSGGSISLSFFNTDFLIGANPVFGYSLTNWLDAGVLANYTYASYHDYYTLGDKLHQSIYGGGAFMRVFPFKFLFGTAQWEHNWISAKYFSIPGSVGLTDDKSTVDANSFLVGGGYCTGRDGQTKSVYGYFSVMFDIVRNKYSPYVDGYNRSIPIIRAGMHIPLFQGK